jgi:hypothetical protein
MAPLQIDWSGMFTPGMSPIEMVLRGTVMYFMLPPPGRQCTPTTYLEKTGRPRVRSTGPAETSISGAGGLA